jgi:DNA polymerase-3 subunit epsilon
MIKGIVLKRPIVFLDLETTGLSLAKDRVIEICMIKVNVDGSRVTYYERIHPEDRPIAIEAKKKHGIDITDLENCPKFKDKAQEIFDFLKGCDLGGYNAKRYDIGMLAEEFSRCKMLWNPRKSVVVDPLEIITKMEPRTLEGTYYSLFGKKLENAHTAEADINATIDIFEKLVEKYGLPSDIDDMDKMYMGNDRDKMVDLEGKMTRDEAENIIFTFGKYRDMKVEDVWKTDAKYFSWMLTGDFTADTKRIVKAIIEKLKE